MMGNGMMGMMNTGMMLLYMILWILIIVGIVLLVIWAVKKARESGHSVFGESVLDILKKRYARGEITKEEYEEKKRDIL
jgi:putative membrane protein